MKEHSKASFSKVSHLQDEQEEEVGIGDPLELLKQVERQKSEGVVFGGFDGIGLQEEKIEMEDDSIMLYKCPMSHALNLFLI